jgi:hypothetical protein
VPALSRDQAEEEVSKLLLDAEILQRLLFYEKNKEEISQCVGWEMMLVALVLERTRYGWVSEP